MSMVVVCVRDMCVRDARGVLRVSVRGLGSGEAEGELTLRAYVSVDDADVVTTMMQMQMMWCNGVMKRAACQW